MKNYKIIIAAFVLAFVSINGVLAQIDFGFKVNTDTVNWKGGTGNQSILSWVNNDFLQIQVTGGFWAVAAYEPKDGISWDFDKNKVVVVKVQKKFGDLYVKFYDKSASKNYKLKDPLPLTINGSTSLIHVIAFENYANDYPELQSGIKTFTNIQIAHEYVSIGQQILVDWIKSFPTIDAAYEYVAPMLDALEDIRSANIRINTKNNSIELSGMTTESMVQLYDMKGVLLRSQTMQNGEISGLSKGVYVLKIDNRASKIIL